MSAGNRLSSSGILDDWQLLELATSALTAESLDEFLRCALPPVAQLTRAEAAFFYATHPYLPAPIFIHHGLSASDEAHCLNLSADSFQHIASSSNHQPLRLPVSLTAGEAGDFFLYPINSQHGCVGLFGLAGWDIPPPTDAWMDALLQTMAHATDHLLERASYQRQLSHLNTYLTVSSMMAQEMGLHDLLETALYCCMQAVSAESATVLLLDEGQEHFTFYQVEGPAQPLLAAACFPADRGIAGAVLQSGQPEIINDVPRDPRWYRAFDADTGIPTRNMIAVPLVAGAEQVGVLEVLNKMDGEPFDQDELLLLVSIAEQIAFAIRNARVFEYVVNTYCKQRQGLATCRGCQRPLRSWTPCVKYREVGI